MFLPRRRVDLPGGVRVHHGDRQPRDHVGPCRSDVCGDEPGPDDGDVRRLSLDRFAVSVEAPLAAIYARKSTEQNVADEEKSVTRQIELALACAKKHGFDVPQEHIYVDDAITGAEFDRRPGLMRLLNAIRPRAPFTALFLADKDRLSRPPSCSLSNN